MPFHKVGIRGARPINREDIDVGFFNPIPDRASRLPPYPFVVVFAVNSQSCYHEFLVAKEMFPDAPELGIDAILGFDFLFTVISC